MVHFSVAAADRGGRRRDRLPGPQHLCRRGLDGHRLVIAGVAQTIHAFAARSWGGFFWGLLVGLLYLAAGIVMWLNPIAGVVTLTVFLAAVLVVDGIFRSILAFQIRPRAGWFWLLLGGIVGIVLGLMIWQQLPSSALSVLGLLLGINLVFSGFTFLMLAMSGTAATTAAA
jgi:uncharacterized membrane protein HdeD (DUF308 family)